MMIPSIRRLIQVQNTKASIETNYKKVQHLPLLVTHNHDAKHLSDQPQLNDTVDGSEIRLSPVEVGSLSPLFTTGFCHIPAGCLGFLNHQQYHIAHVE